jgi:hypothetical protein
MSKVSRECLQIKCDLQIPLSQCRQGVTTREAITEFAQSLPENITIIPLPAKCPELNPVENIWQFMRENWLSNLIFETCEDILDHCCAAWNKLVSMPETITSIGTREWAQEF